MFSRYRSSTPDSVAAGGRLTRGTGAAASPRELRRPRVTPDDHRAPGAPARRMPAGHAHHHPATVSPLGPPDRATPAPEHLAGAERLLVGAHAARPHHGGSGRRLPGDGGRVDER